jgi:hypothetical protein
MGFNATLADKTLLYDSIVDSLDIPQSYYEKARDRYKSLGDWLCRKGSKVAHLNPVVSPQGSFRYGTVTLAILKSEEYDLDIVLEIALSMGQVTQKQAKHLLGDEIVAYAATNGIKAPVVERNRCWRLDYADDLLFHIDALPCIPDSRDSISNLCSQGVPPELAGLAVRITDIRHPSYNTLSSDWFCSNPRGLGNWFEDVARPYAAQRMFELVAKRAYRTIDEIPSYEWKTPLQRAIQLLKRHRDVMSATAPEFAPISMIITILAARAYLGEPHLHSALKAIVDRIPQYVNSTRPFIPNPVNEREDFADRCASDPRYYAGAQDAHFEFSGIVAISGAV